MFVWKVDMGAEDDASFAKAVDKALELLGGGIDTLVLNHVGGSGNYAQEVSLLFLSIDYIYWELA